MPLADHGAPGTIFEGKRILIAGGTGSLGSVLTRRILSGEAGMPEKVVVFSRDETKQHHMRSEYLHLAASTDETIYENASRMLEFRIGDVRDFASVSNALRDINIVFNPAAMKQVPTCEYSAHEAVLTNIEGAHNIVRAIGELRLPVETVVGISTDKAVKPVNVMGMTKAIQERIFISANLQCPDTRFLVVRYGNVLASRGSVIPLFHQQIRSGGPVTITDANMTRFLVSLDDAVSTIFEAVRSGRSAETYIPRIPTARVVDIAETLIDGRPIRLRIVGMRPGEKLHEVLISEEEGNRSCERGDYYVIAPILPELRDADVHLTPLGREYSSAEDLMNRDQIRALLVKNDLLVTGAETAEKELIR